MRVVCSAALLLLPLIVGAHRISVRIEGWGNDTVVVRAAERYDTVVARRGRLGVEVPDSVALVKIWRPRDYTPKYRPTALTIEVVPEGKTEIRGRACERYVDYEVRGSTLNAEIAEYKRAMRELHLRSDSIVMAKEMDMRQFSDNARNIYLADMRFVREHPDSEWSLHLLSNRSGLEGLLPRLTERVRNGRFRPEFDKGQAMQEASRRQEKERQEKQSRRIGTLALDFSLVDAEGRRFTLSDYDAGEGKYIVLDFWGSWCGPCMGGFPRMKEFYARHGGRVEFVGIALDNDAPWREAVARYSLPWTNLLDANGSVVKNYDIDMYPTKIIISPAKQIIAVFPGEGDQFYTELNELLTR